MGKGQRKILIKENGQQSGKKKSGFALYCWVVSKPGFGVEAAKNRPIKKKKFRAGLNAYEQHGWYAREKGESGSLGGTWCRCHVKRQPVTPEGFRAAKKKEKITTWGGGVKKKSEQKLGGGLKSETKEKSHCYKGKRGKTEGRRNKTDGMEIFEKSGPALKSPLQRKDFKGTRAKTQVTQWSTNE